VQCATPHLASTSALPFAWVRVTGVPDGLGPAVAEITDAPRSDTLFTAVLRASDGTTRLQVPVHPSFRRAGGPVSVRIIGDSAACDPVPLTVAPLPAAPGAMAEATRELRRAIDGMLPEGGIERPDSKLARSSRPIPVFAIPALWSYPALERLEGLVQGDSVAASSPEDAAMLDAIAGRLSLPDRMRDLGRLARTVRRLVGDVTVVAHRGESRVSPPDSTGAPGASPGSPVVRFAAYHPGSVASGVVPPAFSASEPSGGGACPSDKKNLFSIAQPAKLDQLMRVQEAAEEFVAGANDRPGGSATGTLFGDMGELMGWASLLGPEGKAAGAAWKDFSEIVLGTSEAYAGLLPNEMELSVSLDPADFDEDSERKGQWTARAVARSEGMKLAEKVVDKLMETALKKGLGGEEGHAGLSAGKALMKRYGRKLSEKTREKAAEKIDKAVLEKGTKLGLDALLEAIGAKEGPEGWNIPGGCWTLPDMSMSDGGSAPPLVVASLSGDAVAFVADGGRAHRHYRPAKAGTSVLTVHTADSYEKATGSLLGKPIGISYAFGGTEYTASAAITVHPIEVDLNPTLQRVKGGEKVPFVATVHHAVDTRVRWKSSANPFDEITDWGDGTHEASLITPKNPRLYPIRIEVESVSRSGARKSGIPVRRAVGYVQLADPILDVRPLSTCVPVDSGQQYSARLLGLDADHPKVVWRSHGPGDGGIDARGWFHAGSRPGTYTIDATWLRDPHVSAEVQVRVEKRCATFEYTMQGDVNGSATGRPTVLGMTGTEDSRSVQLRPGFCSLEIGMEPEGRSRLPSLSLRASVPGGLRVGDYPVGDYRAGATWSNENRSPGTFFAELIAAEPGASRLTSIDFTSTSGAVSIEHVDATGVEGSFHLRFEEQPPFNDFPRKQSASVRGHFKALLLRKPGTEDFYACEAPK